MLINLMMFVITSLFLLVILRDCSGVEIEGCSPNSPKEVNESINYFKCVGIKPDQQVAWNIQEIDHHTKMIRSTNAAVCYLGKICQPLIPYIMAVRSPGADFSVLTVFRESMSYIVSIGCIVFAPQPKGTKDRHDYTCRIKTRGLEIKGCSPGTPKKVGPNINVFKCVGIKPDQHVAWNLKIFNHETKLIQTIPAAICHSGKICENNLSNVHARKNFGKDFSVLIVLKQDMSDVLGIECKVFTSQLEDPEDSQEYYCKVVT